MGKEERCVPNNEEIHSYFDSVEEIDIYNSIEKGKMLTLKQELILDKALANGRR